MRERESFAANTTAPLGQPRGVLAYNMIPSDRLCAVVLLVWWHVSAGRRASPYSLFDANIAIPDGSRKTCSW
jgi:hypothetical protein